MISYRAATIDDAELASDVMTAAYPLLAQDPVVTRHRWQHPRKDYTYGRFLAEREGRAIALLGWVHGPWDRIPDRHCEVEVWLDRGSLDRALLESMFTWIGDRAAAEGSHLLFAYSGEDEPLMLDALAAVGYKRERLEKVWELDLVEHGAKLVADAKGSREEVARGGIELVTLADWGDSDRLSKLYELDAITRQHIPTTIPIVTEAFDDFLFRTKGPDRRADRTWIALDRGRPVALSYMRFPPVRGAVWTGYTCTHPDYRGRGLARATKLQSIAQAVGLGIERVYTDNDSENSPILHINESLGYRRRPGFVEHHKRVTTTSDA